MTIETPPTPLIPHGAKTLVLGPLRIADQRDKLVFSAEGIPDRHWTLHFGGKSGVVDLHESSQAEPDRAHRTLLRVPKEAFWRAFAEVCSRIAPEDFINTSMIQPCRPGWLRRQRFALSRMPDGEGTNGFAALTTRHGRRAKFSMRKWLRHARLTLDPSDLLTWPDGLVLLQHTGSRARRQSPGCVLLATDARGGRRLFMLSTSRVLASQRPLARSVWLAVRPHIEFSDALAAEALDEAFQ